jgi:hypothetical protein
MDNHGLFGKSRFSSSTYSKDFQRFKTEMVDIRQLDSYRNKIKYLYVYLEKFKFLTISKIPSSNWTI